jgi:CBS domain-containing membrane protein
MKNYLSRMKTKGHCPPRKPLKKIIWSWIGSFLGIFLIAYLGQIFTSGDKSYLFLIASFGASAVLVYGAPLAEFSQPRNLVGGHILSAIVGVTIFYFFEDSILLATSLSVSLAIVVMHITRTLHPPGGATALIAVIGGEKIHQLNYLYVLSPVFSGALILLLVALFVNNMSSNPKRHYPVYWI